MSDKTVISIRKAPPIHWVGNGFPVHTFFHYRDDPEFLSPFLLLDYVAPTPFAKTSEKHGVGEHPHRGIETVTIAFSGEVSHRDSNGGSDTITTGGVQWMTAGRGVVHEEMHSDNFRNHGGTLEMIQLWTNLPKTHKMTTPRYQAFSRDSFPQGDIDGGKITLIAGQMIGLKGPALTFTPMDVGLLEVKPKSQVILPCKQGYSMLLFVRNGHLTIAQHNVNAPELAIMSHTGTTIKLSSSAGASVVFLSGEPIREPVVGHGPFVMNTIEEIKQAFQDYEQGLMGHLPD